MDDLTTLQRLKLFIDYKGISVSQFEKSVGMSNGSLASQLKNNKTIGVDKIENILKFYEDLNPTWLLKGTAPMLLNQISSEYNNSINELRKKTINDKKSKKISVDLEDIHEIEKRWEKRMRERELFFNSIDTELKNELKEIADIRTEFDKIVTMIESINSVFTHEDFEITKYDPTRNKFLDKLNNSGPKEVYRLEMIDFYKNLASIYPALMQIKCNLIDIIKLIIDNFKSLNNISDLQEDLQEIEVDLKMWGIVL